MQKYIGLLHVCFTEPQSIFFFLNKNLQSQISEKDSLLPKLIKLIQTASSWSEAYPRPLQPSMIGFCKNSKWL